MIRYFRLKRKDDATIEHIVVSLLLATYCMVFSNELIGGMGGLPMWLGMMLAYYLTRQFAMDKSDITHQLAITRKTEIKYYLKGYSLCFLVGWGIMKILVVISRMIGWGNLNGMSAKEYIDSIYGSTLFERWIYFIVWIVIAGFALSLFPLVFEKNKKRWIAYIVVDSVIFATLCKVIITICNWILPQKKRRMHLKNLLDYLLLFHMPRRLFAILIIGSMLVVLGAIAFFVYKLSYVLYSPKKGVIVKNPAEFRTLSLTEKRDNLRGKLKLAVAVVLSVVIIGAGAYKLLSVIDNNRRQGELNYSQVAECLTKDSNFGPMVYNKEVYVPIDKELSFDTHKENTLGYIAYKGQDCNNKIYKLTIGNLLYKSSPNDKENEGLLQMSGADYNAFEKVSKVQKEGEWRNDQIYVLWDEDWVNETSYGVDKTGYITCEAGFVQSLYNKFGDVKYNPNDFKDYDTYFTIRGYKDMKSVNGTEIICGDWVGCILAKDNNFYYGSYKNQITGLELKELLNILGGSANPTENTKDSKDGIK